MRTLLLSIAVLTLTVVPSSVAASVVDPVAVPAQTTYDVARPDVKFGVLQQDAEGAVFVGVTVLNKTEVTVAPFTVTFSSSTPGWLVDTASVPVPQLGPQAKPSGAFETVLKLTMPGDVKPGATLSITAMAGNLKITGAVKLPSVLLTPKAFKGVKRLGFNGLRYEAAVTVPGIKLSKNTCTTKRLKPSATVYAQTKKGKRKKVAAGDLAKGTLRFKGGACLLAFEFFFDHKLDRKFGSFDFKFSPTIDGTTLKVATANAMSVPDLKPGLPTGPPTTIKKIG
ncbi:MAG: hypothetical protein JHD16_01200 [Solirubrobacteraceae bacterium]|nr:hypothetical protein [Solirubrobacteraceae bacterium]